MTPKIVKKHRSDANTCEEMDSQIEAEIDESYEEELAELLGKENLTDEDIASLEMLRQKVKENRIVIRQIALYYYSKPELKKHAEMRALDFSEKHALIDEKIGRSFEKRVPSSRSEPSEYVNARMKAVFRYIRAMEDFFEVRQKRGVTTNPIGEIDSEEAIVIPSTRSEYYIVRELLRKLQYLFDDMAVYSLKKHDYENAYNYYYLLGEMFIKEVDLIEKTNDRFLFILSSKARAYFNAGEAFRRCYRNINEVYLTRGFGPPHIDYFRPSSQEVFDAGNIGLTIEQLAIKSFERAKEEFRKYGHKEYYLKSRDRLYQLKEETNDFEMNIVRLFVEISQTLISLEPPFISILKDSKKVKDGCFNNPKKLEERYIRNFFKTHIEVLIKEIVYAESLRTTGKTDLILHSREGSGLFHKKAAIAEFKIWGRNTQGEHSYKNVLNQLRKYLTSFEIFGLVVMINLNKRSIKTKYIENIILKDKFYVNGSLEDLAPENTFMFFRSNHFVNDDKDKTRTIYHFILNLRPFFD